MVKHCHHSTNCDHGRPWSGDGVQIYKRSQPWTKCGQSMVDHGHLTMADHGLAMVLSQGKSVAVLCYDYIPILFNFQTYFET